MATRLYSVVFDANDIRALGRWWADALGWQVVLDDPDEVEVADPDDRSLSLAFVPVEGSKTVKNRVHLDLASSSLEDQMAIVERLVAAGATRADIGQVDVAWEVLRDPEGNELCVLAPNDRLGGFGPVAGVGVDAVDVATMAEFWAEATGWTPEPREEEGDGDVVLRNPARPAPYVEILEVPEAKSVKARVHIDLAPWADHDQAAEVDRLLAAGATHADVGQGPNVTWVVLADPEGNEFCVLSSRDD